MAFDRLNGYFFQNVLDSEFSAGVVEDRPLVVSWPTATGGNFRNRLRVSVAYWVVPVSSSGLPSLLASESATNDTSDVTTAAMDTTGADVIVIVGGFAITEPTITDSQGNSWTTIASGTDGGVGSGARHQIFMCVNPTTSTTHTFTNTTFAPSICVAAFRWPNVTIVAGDTTSDGETSATSVSPGSVTPANVPALMISGFATNNNTEAEDATVASPYTKIENAAAEASNNVGCALAYRVQSSTAADNPEWSQPGASKISASLVALIGI